MKASHCTILVAALTAATLNAQSTPPRPYQSVVCLKLQPGKSSSEYRQFVGETSVKMNQMRADAGEIVSWTLLRTVMPAGEDARCDFIQSTIRESTPPLDPTPEGLAAALEKARVKMTASEYLARRGALVRLVSSELWRPVIRVGQPQKGSYIYVNYIQELNAAEYRKFENEVFKPMAELMIKDGKMAGWMFGLKQLPGGTGWDRCEVHSDDCRHVRYGGRCIQFWWSDAGRFPESAPREGLPARLRPRLEASQPGTTSLVDRG
jgi:hypothetical protein